MRLQLISSWSRLIAVWCASFGALCVSNASAQPPDVQVKLHGCPDLSHAEITRLLRLELSALSGPSRTPLVEVACGPDQIELTMSDSAIGWSLSRKIPALSSDAPGRERVVALAASQLVLAWTPTVSAPQRTPAPEPRIEPMIEEVEQSPAEPKKTWLLQLGGSGATRPDILIAPGVVAALSHDVGRNWRLRFGAHLESGVAERNAGEVRADMLLISAGIGYRALQGEHYRVDLSLDAGGGLLEFNGQSDSVEFFGERKRGATGQVTLSVEPGLRFDAFDAGLRLSGGGLLPEIRASVEGEEAVSLRGPYAGAALLVGTRF